MRWQSEKEPEYGDKRIKTKFLLFPIEINREVRWLEKATYKETYCYNNEYQFHEWVPSKWIDI